MSVEHAPNNPIRPQIIVNVTFVILAVSFATRAVVGIGMQEWLRDLGWSRGEVSSASALALVVMAIIVPLAGSTADRIGGRNVLVAGTVSLALGLSITATMRAYWELLLGYGIFCGIGFGLASLPVAGSYITRHIEQGRGLATGIATAGTTGGQLFILPALVALFPVIGWRFALGGLAVFAVLAGIFALLALRPGDQDPSNRKKDVVGLRYGLRSLLTARAFHGLLWSFTLCGFTATGIVETHLIPFTQACGFSAGAGTAAYAVFALFNLVGMVGAGWLADRVDRRLLLVGIYLTRTAAFMIPLWAPTNYFALLMFSVSVGVAFYATFPGTIGLAGAHFGASRVGLVVGMLTVGHSLGAAAGAWAGGAIFDLFFRYEAMWTLATILALGSAGFALLVNDPRPPSYQQFGKQPAHGSGIVASPS